MGWVFLRPRKTRPHYRVIHTALIYAPSEHWEVTAKSISTRFDCAKLKERKEDIMPNEKIHKSDLEKRKPEKIPSATPIVDVIFCTFCRQPIIEQVVRGICPHCERRICLECG